jgi:deoxyribodipyrimidine photolyase-related protein
MFIKSFFTYRIVMTKKAILILPNGLFEKNDIVVSGEKCLIIIYEHPVFFTKYPYHQMKLVLHRSSMKYYADYLVAKKNIDTENIVYLDYNKSLDKILRQAKISNLVVHDPVDYLVEGDLERITSKLGIRLEIVETPLFMDSRDDLIEYGKNKKILRHSDFYKKQRIKYDILVKNGQPVGGKWSFDQDNRSTFPATYHEKPLSNISSLSKGYIDDAIKYINKNFSDNPGDPNLYLSIDFPSVKKFYQKFVHDKLECFGKYQDAVSSNVIFGNHSVVSPLMNIGLITPEYALKVSTNWYQNHPKKESIIASYEGYIRQLIGWRSYCRLIYLTKYDILEKENYFNHRRKLSDTWYYGNKTTGMILIDDLIQKTIKYGYLHHIERLMYIGNYMLLTETNPKDCFNWFQSMFIDSYHVFMYPNVYGMSQHSAGPIMMTRPYFSSSAYLRKMSNFKKEYHTPISIGNKIYQWYDIWDILFYNFVNRHADILAKNYSTAIHVKNLHTKLSDRIDSITKIANKYINNPEY